MQIILTYGCNDAVTSYNETSANVTINDESVVFNFTNGQLVPVTSAWQQGSTPMFFYRTVNDGSSDVKVVCDPEGKLYVNDHDDYILHVNDSFVWSTGAASQTLITNCGGKVAMDVAAGDDNLMTVISMDDYTVVFTEDGEVTVGEITQSQFDIVVEIFADAECTTHPTGDVSKVYAKFYKTVNSSKTYNNSLEIRMQSEENSVYWYDDYIGEGGTTLGEIPANTIVELNSTTGLNDVTNYRNVYYL